MTLQPYISYSAVTSSDFGGGAPSLMPAIAPGLYGVMSVNGNISAPSSSSSQSSSTTTTTTGTASRRSSGRASKKRKGDALKNEADLQESANVGLHMLAASSSASQVLGDGNGGAANQLSLTDPPSPSPGQDDNDRVSKKRAMAAERQRKHRMNNPLIKVDHTTLQFVRAVANKKQINDREAINVYEGVVDKR
jgi:hypothetical protein